VSAEIRRIDPTLPAFDVATLADVARERLGPRRAGSAVVGAFGLLALGLAALGLYGLVSYIVHQRRREIGIRMALGADSRQIVRLVLAEGIRIALVGLALGAGFAVAATSLLSSMFVTVSAFDIGTWAFSAATVVAAVLAASAVPAMRAARLDPIVTLRNE
jgi:ABC-type antimicrobial peptide transport system permease subunit